MTLDNSTPSTNIDTLRIQVLVAGKLATAISYNMNELVKMSDGSPLTLVAWHGRNLLELTIWTEYCLQSSENATRFAVDAVRDTDDLIQLVGPNEIEANPETKKHIENFRLVRAGLAEEITSEDLSQRYTDVRNAAETIGKLSDYKRGMKVFSKWAHPTALAVMSGALPADAENSLRIILTRSAIEMGTEALKIVKAFTDKNRIHA